jgi:hypothetical protein
MCCVRGSVNFSDPAIREAYIAARRNPSLRSVNAELVGHYEAFWKGHWSLNRRRQHEIGAPIRETSAILQTSTSRFQAAGRRFDDRAHLLEVW